MRPFGIGMSAAWVALILPTHLFAQDLEAEWGISSDGHRYDVTCNENGFVLTSHYPTSRFVENGVLSEVVEGIETIYLGKSCDAFAETFGKGTWGMANGGYAVAFETKSIGFPRQEPRCPSSDADALSFEMDCPL